LFNELLRSIAFVTERTADGLKELSDGHLELCERGSLKGTRFIDWQGSSERHSMLGDPGSLLNLLHLRTPFARFENQ
jgi:hypothetical protein